MGKIANYAEAKSKITRPLKLDISDNKCVTKSEVSSMGGKVLGFSNNQLIPVDNIGGGVIINPDPVETNFSFTLDISPAVFTIGNNYGLFTTSTPQAQNDSALIAVMYGNSTTSINVNNGVVNISSGTALTGTQVYLHRWSGSSNSVCMGYFIIPTSSSSFVTFNPM